MRRKQWLIIVVLLVGFYFVQHHAIPSLPLPVTPYTQRSNTLTIHVSMQMPKGNQSFWLLGQTNDHVYVVNAFNNYKLLRQFPTTKKLMTNDAGTTYATTGQVRIDSVLYQAQTIQVNSDGKTGDITLASVSQSSSAQTTNASVKNAS